MKSFETFQQLHRNEAPLLLANIWDVNSARIFESKGYSAIGTSSQAVATSFGYEDGEKMPFDLLFLLAKRVVEIVNIPLTVDIEGGFSRSLSGILQNIDRLHDIGVVGLNLEDSLAGDTRRIQPVAAFQQTLEAVAEHKTKHNLKIFLNVRTDGFLLKMPTALSETLERIKSYENAGADGIFVPCITNSADIKQVVNSTELPVNVMLMPNLPSVEELQSLGVKRVSMGPFAYQYVNKKTEDVANLILTDNRFQRLFV